MDPRMKPGSDGSRPNSVLRRRRSRRLTNGRPASPGCARFLFSSCFLLLSRASPAAPIAAASARFLFSSCSLRENQRRVVVSGVLIFFCYLQERRPWNASSRTRGIFPAYSRNGRGRERNTSQRRILAKRSQPRTTSSFRMTARGARKRSCRSRAAPDLPRHLHDPGKLCPFDLFGPRDVLGGAGREPALRAQA